MKAKDEILTLLRERGDVCLIDFFILLNRF